MNWISVLTFGIENVDSSHFISHSHPNFLTILLINDIFSHSTFTFIIFPMYKYMIEFSSLKQRFFLSCCCQLAKIWHNFFPPIYCNSSLFLKLLFWWKNLFRKYVIHWPLRPMKKPQNIITFRMTLFLKSWAASETCFYSHLCDHGGHENKWLKVLIRKLHDWCWLHVCMWCATKVHNSCIEHSVADKINNEKTPWCHQGPLFSPLFWSRFISPAELHY